MASKKASNGFMMRVESVYEKQSKKKDKLHPDNIVSTNPYSSSASGNLEGEVATFGRVSTYKRIPRDGYDAQVAVHPNISFPSGTSYSRGGIVRHAVREAYFRTTEKLPYRQAHKKAGGQTGYPPGTMVGGTRH